MHMQCNTETPYQPHCDIPAPGVYYGTTEAQDANLHYSTIFCEIKVSCEIKNAKLMWSGKKSHHVTVLLSALVRLDHNLTQS